MHLGLLFMSLHIQCFDGYLWIIKLILYAPMPKQNKLYQEHVISHKGQSLEIFSHPTTFYLSLIMRKSPCKQSQHRLMMLTDILTYITEEMQLSEETRRLLENGCQVVGTSCSQRILIKFEHLWLRIDRSTKLEHPIIYNLVYCTLWLLTSPHN